jgi:hypothetical protein
MSPTTGGPLRRSQGLPQRPGPCTRERVRHAIDSAKTLCATSVLLFANVACGPANPPGLQNGPSLRGAADAGSGAVGAGTVRDAGAAESAVASPEAGAPDSRVPLEAGSAAPYDAAAFGDSAGLVPIDDAAGSPVTPPTTPMRGGGGDSTVCAQALGWLVSGATLDPTVVSASAAAQLNPLLATQHPLTLAELGSDAGQLLQVSGTLANGISQQYFPYQFPASPVPLTLSTSGPLPTLIAAPAAAQTGAGFIHIVDASATDVWIAIASIGASATAGDALCQSLTGGEIDAVIPAAAGSTAMTLASGTTTVASLFGDQTSTAPQGWTVRLWFPTAAIAQVTFK